MAFYNCCPISLQAGALISSKFGHLLCELGEVETIERVESEAVESDHKLSLACVA